MFNSSAAVACAPIPPATSLSMLKRLLRGEIGPPPPTPLADRRPSGGLAPLADEGEVSADEKAARAVAKDTQGVVCPPLAPLADTADMSGGEAAEEWGEAEEGEGKGNKSPRAGDWSASAERPSCCTLSKRDSPWAGGKAPPTLAPPLDAAEATAPVKGLAGDSESRFASRARAL